MELNATVNSVTVVERKLEVSYVSAVESTSQFIEVPLVKNEKKPSYLTDFKNKAPVEIRFEGITYVVPQGFRGKRWY